jgi:hypothetical protein
MFPPGPGIVWDATHLSSPELSARRLRDVRCGSETDTQLAAKKQGGSTGLAQVDPALELLRLRLVMD